MAPPGVFVTRGLSHQQKETMHMRKFNIKDMPSWVVIIRSINTRGEQQQEALAELERRRLWLAPDQKIAAGLVKPGQLP